ncbi:hypothetical protein IJ380_01455 [Candidatus Saccharibacteria bacterium]|nr:hypothetical protein [Candidatus Saccharibacteria bacterium]
MYRLSTIIEEVYRTFLPLAEKKKISFNLDFPDPTKRVERPSLVKNPLLENTEAAILRAKKSVSIVVKKNSVVVSDDGEVLPTAKLKEIREAENIKAKSRVGFGTEVEIFF